MHKNKTIKRTKYEQAAFDLQGTIYSDEEIETDTDDENANQEHDPELRSFFEDFYMVKDVGNFNDSLGKAIINMKAAKKKKKIKRQKKDKEEPLKYEISKEAEHKSEFGAVSKYMDKLEYSVPLDQIIKSVIAEKNLTFAKDLSVNPVEAVGEKDDGEQKVQDKIKVKAHEETKKEKKKGRKVKEREQQLEKEKKELQFEDAPPPDPNLRFKDMGLSTGLMRAIRKMGYEKPTPIQSATMPIALKGRDICGCAATGTGKTAAFMLPIFERLFNRPDKTLVTRVLVLVPTRELGVQVYEVTKQLSQYIQVSISLIVGGLDMQQQGSELKQIPDVIIATPGRLIDHIHNTGSFSLSEIEILVLDEADRMLDENFEDQLMEIVRQCRIERQTMLFSATMTDAVKDLIAVSLQRPVRAFVNRNTDVAQNLQQEFVRIRGKNPEKYRPAILAYLVSSLIKEQCIVFVRRKSDCHRIRIMLSLLGVNVQELHGNLNQTQRLTALKNFKAKETNILLASDVAARGLDIPGVAMVINYNLPSTYEYYVHRVGRTARAGLPGTSVTISSDFGKDHTMLKAIQKHSLTPLYERVIAPTKLHHYCDKIESLEEAIERVLELEENCRKTGSKDFKIQCREDKKTKKKEQKERKKKLREEKGLLATEVVVKTVDVEQEKTVMWNKKKIAMSELEKMIEEKEHKLRGYSAGILPLTQKKAMKEQQRKKEEALNKRMRERLEMRLKGVDTKQRGNKKFTKDNKENKNEFFEEPNKPGKRKIKSSFEAELTNTDERYLKKMRKGPSYLEKKEHYESKNPGERFTMKGKPANYTGMDKSRFNDIGGGDSKTTDKANKAQLRFFNDQEKTERGYKDRNKKKFKSKDKDMFAGTKSMLEGHKGNRKKFNR